ncbi:MAG TPA: glycogen debranching N-terminal domain-containing protein [Actinophytocola sp.]|uniref:glycogen debranching N-terminal domain-containing protein n=1 Tax=Actinophytocola sp. TaxID=1872138 RepID=UPI002DDD2CA3|nr:glycogen debranching N-terminal domain-containing protein [Actinophytocola sp.]HEV2782418.1 glycogen debranching N-terminal domain-containing protein [Actinophytocola sp.]
MPALHDLITVLHAPDLVLSASDGQIRSGGSDGWYRRDRRALAQLEISVADGRVVPIGMWRNGASAVTVQSMIAPVAGNDPSVTIGRHRALSPSALTDRVELTNFGTSAATLTLRARVSTDLAGIDAVRSMRLTQPAAPLLHEDNVRWEADDITVSLRCTPAPSTASVAGARAELAWEVELPPRSAWSLLLSGACDDRRHTGFLPAPAVAPQWTVPLVPGEVRALVDANLADLDALLLADPDVPQDRFVAAGAPWYLTLFGRDALWTARMLLAVGGAELAAGTLRILARRQGVRHDPESEEAPGKILHEARPAPQRTPELTLPATYYGTIDATALWVCLLHDAWRAGMPTDEVAALLPNLVAAMEWITGPDADPDGDGLLEYAGSTSGGLANQGWKDSADAIRHLDGRFAQPPVALCEVQGYAYAAAAGAASLAGAFGLAEGSAWLDWAQRLRDRFHAAFWLRDEVGPYPAIALDAAKTPVSGATSNMGHLLGTGLLSTEQARSVAERLAAPDLTTPYGLRTMTTTHAAYNPISYHCGSVWPHDTAIAIMGLATEGHHDLAGTLSEALLRAAQYFDARPPELYGVLDDGPPVHYPSACRPQAWAAAAIIVAALHARRAGP